MSQQALNNAPNVHIFEIWIPILCWVSLVFFALFIAFLPYVGFLAFVSVLISVTVYVRYDSKRFQIANRSFLVLVLFVVGLPLYSYDLYLLRDKQKRIHESSIEEQRDETKVYESDVGERVFCHYCGQTMPSDAMFCRKCGRKQILV